MYPLIKIQGEEALVKFPKSSFFIKTSEIENFEKDLQELIEKYAL